LQREEQEDEEFKRKDESHMDKSILRSSKHEEPFIFLEAKVKSLSLLFHMLGMPSWRSRVIGASPDS